MSTECEDACIELAAMCKALRRKVEKLEAAAQDWKLAYAKEVAENLEMKRAMESCEWKPGDRGWHWPVVGDLILSPVFIHPDGDYAHGNARSERARGYRFLRAVLPEVA